MTKPQAVEHNQLRAKLERAEEAHGKATQRLATYLSNLGSFIGLRVAVRKKDRNFQILNEALKEARQERDFAAARLARFESGITGEPYIRLVGGQDD